MELMEDGTTIERKMFEIAAEKHIPLYGVLELVPVCNMNCDMCYVRLSREEMEKKGGLCPVEKWIAVAQQMRDTGTLFLLLTGGEPLLYPDFRRLYLKLQEMGMILTVNTNGTLIDKEWADFFAKNKPRRINITVYGASETTYGEVCHYPEGFNRAMKGIRLLLERGVDVKMNGSLAKANAKDAQKIIRIGEELDVPVRMDTYMYPTVRERDCAYHFESRMEPEDAGKIRVEVLRKEMGEELFAEYRKRTLCMAEHTPEGKGVPGKMKCRAGKSSFTINWQGEMRACVVLDDPSVPVFETGFAYAWDKVVKGTEEIRTSIKCSQCTLREVCNICAASAVAEGGASDSVPEYLCKYTKQTIESLKATEI